MRLSVLVACLACLAACGPGTRALPPTDEELRLIACLTRDPFVVVEHSQRDGNGHLLVITRQGRTSKRYLIAPDDPANPKLRLRPLEDACTLVTVPNDQPGGRPRPR